jgi:hypothetical protein
MNNNEKLTNNDLERLKEKLPPKYLMELTRRLSNHSISAIRSVLRGDYFNNEIIDAAIELAEEHQNGIKARKEKISNL